MSSLLEQLHDIEGLDTVSVWPLAAGWWYLIVLGICLTGFILGIIFYRISFNRSWKKDTFQKLALLEKNLNETTARETATTLSEYLRRIAIKRFSRKECAGLVGERWLKWLAHHDPKKFDWEEKGVVLVNLPYAPLNSRLCVKEIQDLINAVRGWVR